MLMSTIGAVGTEADALQSGSVEFAVQLAPTMVAVFVINGGNVPPVVAMILKRKLEPAGILFKAIPVKGELVELPEAAGQIACAADTPALGEQVQVYDVTPAGIGSFKVTDCVDLLRLFTLTVKSIVPKELATKFLGAFLVTLTLLVQSLEPSA